MACGCQKGKAAGGGPVLTVKAEGGKTPTDQCIFCAGKHLAEAWGCYYEFGYRSDDLRQIQSALRLMVLHCYKAWPQLGKLARDCAVLIQRADFNAFEKSLDQLCRLYDQIFAEVEPEVEERRAAAGAECDVIIPLGPGSIHGNDELRFLLRSIEKNALGVGRVILATDCPPEWLSDEVSICKCGDPIGNNKDANLILKTVKAIKEFGVINMTWCADDNAFLKPIRLSRIPTIYNHRKKEDYVGGGGRWRERVLSTFDWAESKGVKLDHSLESHAPQTFLDCGKLPELAKAEDFIGRPVTVMTFFHVLLNSWSGNANGLAIQDDWKSTYEGLGDFTPPTKTFIGYNDSGLDGGLYDWLKQEFPQKSKYER